MAYLLTFSTLAALFLSSISLFRYGNIQHQHILVTLSVLTAWCFSFLIIFTIPLDVTSTLYRQCLQENKEALNSNEISIAQNRTENLTDVGREECQAPWGMIPPDNVFPNLWRIIYWSSQFLTWLIMPLMQSYLKAGDFTIKGKLRSAIVENVIYCGSYLLICGILLVYIAAKGVSLDWQKLKAIASSASNTWGLFLLVLLLGYALVKVPRSLWNDAKPGYTLQYAYFKLAKLSSEKAEAEEHVDDVLETLLAISHSIPNNHELRICVETILQKVPTELQQRANRNYSRGGNVGSSSIPPSEKALVRVHKQVIKTLQTFQRTEALWNIQVKSVLYLEDITRNMNSGEKRFKFKFPQNRSQLGRILYNSTIHWYWECFLRPYFLKSLFVMASLMSFIVVWSELTFFKRKPILSIAAHVINWAKHGNDFFTIEVFSMLVLCYLFYCTYSTILRIRFLNLYYLAPHHQTNEHSLIFSGMLLCRLTPPMCLNFLGLIQMDSRIIKKHILETYYTQVMGHMDVIGIVSDGFNIYFPMCMLAFCLATWFSLGSRALNILGFQQFLQNETITTELVQEGKDLIAREKRRRQRAEENIGRRREFIRKDSIDNTNVTPANEYLWKYRNIASNNVEKNLEPMRSSAHGLLQDDDNIDYSALSSSSQMENNLTDLPRSLSDEINERFGLSAQLKVGFKIGENISHNDIFEDFNEDDRSNTGVSRTPPRGLFDDV